MSRFVRTRAWAIVAAALLVADTTAAQGYGGPLTMQGVNQQNNASVASRAFGGVTFGRGGDVALMFTNPASLHGIDGIAVSLGGFTRSQDLEQIQQYAPVRYFPNLSLLLENRTDGIPDPDPDLIGFTPADSVQRPFDDIQPSWAHDRSSTAPLHALVAVPFTLGDVVLTAGAGAVRYANLDHYYQNNNVLDPGVLTQRPLPFPRPTDDNPLAVNWYQSVRSREGSIYGYGASVAAHFPSLNLTVGLSGMALSGSSDDLERQVQRGRLTFFANEFRADSAAGRMTRTGTSEYSGQEFALSTRLSGRYVSAGFVVRPPTRITRTFSLAASGDTSGTPISGTVSGEDRIQLPWRGSVGLLLEPRDDLRVGLEYEIRPYGSATFTDAAGVETSPWESASVFRIGAEVQLFPWLAIRGGMRTEAEVFVPEGSALVDEPVSYRVFSAGIELSYAALRWNVTYEHANVRYEDVWASAVSRNSDLRHLLSTQISYTLPFGRSSAE
ncbi:MAG TPA: hypothetical protein VF190_15010 [Rhodothermales bacterium]